MGKRATGLIHRNKVQTVKPPVLHMPNKVGRFHLYSGHKVNLQPVAHYIKYRGSKPKLIAYASKRLPGAAKKLLNHRIRTM